MGEYGFAFYVAAAVAVVLLLVIVALLLYMRQSKVSKPRADSRPTSTGNDAAGGFGAPPLAEERLDETQLMDMMVTANNMGDEVAYRKYKRLWLSSLPANELVDEPAIPRDKETAAAVDSLLGNPGAFFESSLQDIEAILSKQAEDVAPQASHTENPSDQVAGVNEVTTKANDGKNLVDAANGQATAGGESRQSQ